MQIGPLVAFVLGIAPAASSADAVDALLRQRGEAFVAAMNAQGDALASFAAQHLESRVAREGRSGRFAEMMRKDHAETGSIDRHSVQVLSGGRLVFVYVRSAKSGTWLNYQFRVVAEDAHRLQLVFRATAIEPLERPAAPLGTAEAERWLERFQARLEQQQPFSGVALVSAGGKDVHCLVRGVANATSGEAVTRDTRFGMASGSKMFTAVAVLQLAQKGKLALSDSLARHLPGFPNPEFAKRATIHELLTHTAGAGDYWDEAYEKAWGSITELGQLLPFVLPHLGASTPGAFSYSNSGYVLLGLVVEAITGRSYYDYVRDNVLVPAGMTATGYPVRGDGTPGVALAYEPEMDAGAVKRGVYLPAALGARGSSAGGASTTADDLVRFAKALRGGVLLDQAHLQRLTLSHVPYAGPDSWYGYGVVIEKSRGVFSYGHGGTAPGTQFELRIYPELDSVLVVMSNYNTIAGPEVASALDHLVRNAPR
jgi:CubicO group peptidase (beta-lactamase class C family)